jgi:hypothetical protein
MSACRFAASAGGESAAEFRERFMRLFRKTMPETIKAYGFTECMPAAWTFAGVELGEGDRATALAALLMDGTPVHPSPAWLCMRVGPHGTVIQGTGHTHSIVAPRAGPMEVAMHVPAPRRPLPAHRSDTEEHHSAPVVAAIVAIVWRESALRGLRDLASAGDVDGLVRIEINRLCNPAEGRAALDRHSTACGPGVGDRTLLRAF